MNKYSFFLLLCWAFSISASAQDMIVKSNNDTIFCKITDVSDNKIRYKVKNNYRITTSSINTKHVVSYTMADSTYTQAIDSIVLPVYRPALWLSVGGGYSRMLGELIETGNSNADAVSRDLQNGFVVEASFEYFPKWKPNNANYGIALNAVYNVHTGGASNVPVFDSGTAAIYFETQTRFYIGPAFTLSGDFNKMKFSGLMGIGALFYSSNMEINTNPLNASTTMLGSYFGCKLDYKLPKQNTIGLAYTMVSGAYDKLKSDIGTITYSEKMSAASWHLLLTYSHKIDFNKK